MAAGMGWLGFSLPKDSGDRHLHGDGVPLLPLLSDGSGCSLIMEQDWSCRNNPRLDDYSDRPEENHNNESILHDPHRIFQTDQAESVKPQFLVPSLSSISPMRTFSSDGLSMISELKSWLRKNPPFPSEDRSAVSINQDLSSEDGQCRSTAAKPIARKPMEHLGQRTSKFRGVTRHRWTGRYEAHLWDNSCRKEGQARKGRQVYLGGYDKEEKAARAYDLAALKYWGPTSLINFPLSTYVKELEEMNNMTRLEFVAHLRRQSSGFSRGASVYRGVTRHHQHGRWQARIGRVAGNKDLYLGTFSTQEEAAEAYDIAAIKFRGAGAVTNFEISRYDVNRICSSSTLFSGSLAQQSSLESIRDASSDRSDFSSISDHHRSKFSGSLPHQLFVVPMVL